MKRGWAVLFIFLAAFGCLPAADCAHADEACPFSIEPVFPADNIGEEGYHIAGRPGETVTLQARLKNLTSRTIEIGIVALSAYSGPEGIFYESPDQVDSGVFALADERGGMANCIDTVDRFLLVAGMTAVLSINVTVPDIGTGMLLGGIRVTANDGTKKDQAQTMDTTIRIDLPREAVPLAGAGDMDISGGLITIPVINQAAAIAGNVTGAYEVRDGRGRAMLEGDIALPEMAPMSVYNILCPFESQAWEEGAYTLHMRVDTDGRGKEFAQGFTVGEAGQTELEAMREIEPAEAAALPEAASTASAVAPQEAAPAAAAAAGHARVEAFTEPGAALSGRVFIQGAASCIAIGVPACFVCIIIWMYSRNRKRGKHERPRRAAGKCRPAVDMG